MSNRELGFLIFEATYLPNNVYWSFSSNWEGSFWGWLKEQKFKFFIFNIFFIGLFSLFLFFPLVVLPSGLHWFILQEFWFVSREANDTSPSEYSFDELCFSWLSVSSKCHHRLINYHPNLILMILLSNMNLAMTNI